VTTHPFEVELRGLVDLVGRHLYSGPQVYLRELVQNAVDALHIRENTDTDTFDARVLLVPADVSDDGRLHCQDTGAGLGRTAMTEFLSRIGCSTKRDELGFAPGQVQGQFGVGLLSCFLIGDEVEVVSRSVADAPAMRWRATAQGRYSLDVVEDPRTGSWPAPGTIGTSVRITPRPEARHWAEEATVTALAEEYAGMLPHRIDVLRSDGSTLRVSGQQPWWHAQEGASVPEPEARAQMESLLGMPVLATLAVSVPEAGLRGAIAIRGSAGSPAADIGHRVYAKGMLVGTSVPGLLPPWAFFARVVADTDQFRLTVSREALYADDLVEQVRQQLGEQLRLWLRRTSRTNPTLFHRFLEVHEPAIRSVAVWDPDLFEVVLPWLTFETTVGPRTLPDLARRLTEIRYVQTSEEYRLIAPVARAHDLVVIDAGHEPDEELLIRFSSSDPAVPTRPITLDEIVSRMPYQNDFPSELTRRFCLLAQAVLDEAEVEVELLGFEPHTLPGVIDDNRDMRRRRADRRIARTQDGVWAQVVTDLDDSGRNRPRVLFNYYNSTVRRVAELRDDALLSLGVQALYSQVLLLGSPSIRPTDLGLLDRALTGLLERAAVADEIRVEQG
jgi:molecular chaperone HtpG